MSRIEYSWQVVFSRACFRFLDPLSLPEFNVRSVSDPPAVLRFWGLCTGVSAPNTPFVCFKVGRFTLTQSSWTVSLRCSRKWMSGRAAIALVLLRDRRTSSKV